MSILVVVGCGDAPRVGEVLVVTDDGAVRGTATRAIRTFLGIPYAAAPVEDLRWRPPQRHAPWLEPIDATAFGGHCPQVTSILGSGTASTAEDCLFLNVYTPNRTGSQRPVMVWIHGGAFVRGESDVYNPRELVERGDVVVVTINYRLGALGFLAHPALTAESPDHVSGNYGLLDQQFALQWVARNIAAFGGDARQVTIFGQSAGGVSVYAQLASPLAEGLFQRAIVQSGAIFQNTTLATAEGQGVALATALGCDDQSAACLRAASVEAILANQGAPIASTLDWYPVVDGRVLQQDLQTALKSGLFNRVPVIEGSTHDEGRLYLAALFDLAGGPITADRYEDAISSFLPVPLAVAPYFAARYPLAKYPSPDLALGTMESDLEACVTRATSRSLSSFVPTYAYEFADENAPEVLLPPASFPYGAAHGTDVQYIFDVTSGVPEPPLDPSQRALSRAMIRYWTSFARSGVPSDADWPAYQASDVQGGTLLSLVPPSPRQEPSSSFAADHQCDFWDPLLGS